MNAIGAQLVTLWAALALPMSHLWAQVQATVPAVQTTVQNDPFAAQVTTSAVVVYVLQWLKKQQWFPLVQMKGAQRLNRIAAVIAAGMSAAGLHATFDHNAGVLTITGLTAVSIVTALWSWLKAFAIQEVIYQGAVNKQGVPNP